MDIKQYITSTCIAEYILNGETHVPPQVSGDEAEGIFADKRIRISRKISDCGDGLFKIESTWKNIGDGADGGTEDYIFAIRLTTVDAPHFSVIPGVMYNKNAFGNGNEPKGLSRDGEPWVFSYSRSGIPSVTISEGAYTVAMFADCATKESLISAGSLSENPDGTYTHRIYYPEIELPVTYAYRDAYSAPIKNYISLSKGQSFSVTAYAVISKPKYPNFGLMAVYDKALEVFNPQSEKVLSNQKVWDMGIGYAKEWLLETHGEYKLFSIGCMPDKDGIVRTRSSGLYELGWCGQNAALARAFICHHRRYGDKNFMQIGIDVIDTWVKHNRFENGLIGTHFPDDLTKPVPDVADTCNMGGGAYHVLCAYEELKAMGIDKPEWLAYGNGLCDFMCGHYSEDYGFGKLWDANGNLVDGDGTVGIFINMPLIKAYQICKDDRYLETAERALAFYDQRDLQRFACTAGALDTCCVDKETCYPILNTAISLYEITGKAYYLEVAERAGYYLLSWTYLYDVEIDANSDMKNLGYRTLGGTSVSAQHHHLDPWGVLICQDLERLYKITGESKWHSIAQLMWNNGILCIADRDFVYDGIAYPYGAQGEASFHTNWGFQKLYGSSPKGGINKWFVAWPTAMRLWTLMYDQEFLIS